MKNFDCFIIAILFGTILPSAISQVSTIYEQGLNNGKWATQARASFEYN